MSDKTISKWIHHEYLNKRRALEARLRAAEDVYARVVDPRYTTLTINGAALALSEVQHLRRELTALRETFHARQTKRSESQ